MGLLATLGLRAVAGGGALVLDPSGGLVGLSTAVLRGTPFRRFLVPGLVLLALGVASLAAAVAVYVTHRLAWPAAVAVALWLGAWVVAEGVWLGFGRRLQYPNLLQAAVLLALSALPRVRAHLDAPLSR